MIAARAQEEDPSIAVLAASIAKHGRCSRLSCGGTGRRAGIPWSAWTRRVLACRMLGMKQIDALLFEGGAPGGRGLLYGGARNARARHFLDEAQMLRHLGARNASQACCALPRGKLPGAAHAGDG